MARPGDNSGPSKEDPKTQQLAFEGRQIDCYRSREKGRGKRKRQMLIVIELKSFAEHDKIQPTLDLFVSSSKF